MAFLSMVTPRLLINRRYVNAERRSFDNHGGMSNHNDRYVAARLRYERTAFGRGPPRPDLGDRRLKAPAVDLFHLESVDVHAIQAPNIDGRHLCAGLRMSPDCE